MILLGLALAACTPGTLEETWPVTGAAVLGRDGLARYAFNANGMELGVPPVPRATAGIALSFGKPVPAGARVNVGANVDLIDATGLRVP